MLPFTVFNIYFSIIFSSIDYRWFRFCDVFSYIFGAYTVNIPTTSFLLQNQDRLGFTLARVALRSGITIAYEVQLRPGDC